MTKYFDPNPDHPTVWYTFEALAGHPEIAANLMRYIAHTDLHDLDPDVWAYVQNAAAKITGNLLLGKKPKADKAFGLASPANRKIDRITRLSDICQQIEYLRQSGEKKNVAIEMVAKKLNKSFSTILDIYEQNKAWATEKGRMKRFFEREAEQYGDDGSRGTPEERAERYIRKIRDFIGGGVKT